MKEKFADIKNFEDLEKNFWIADNLLRTHSHQIENL